MRTLGKFLISTSVALVLCACTPEQGRQAPSLESLIAAQPADFDELDPPVREQFHTLQREALNRIEQGAEGAPLANAVGALGMWHHVYYAWDPDSAFHLYATAAQLNPTDARWPYYTGFTALKLGRLDEARKAFEAVAAINPNDAPALIHLAEIDLQQGQAAQARTLFLRIQQLQPGSPRVLGGLGDAAFQEGDYATAIDYLKQALELWPDAPQLNYKLALAYQRTGQTELANQQFEDTPHSQAVPDLAFDNPYQKVLLDMNVGSLSKVSLARQALAARNTAEAIRLGREAVQIAANRKTPLLNLASIYVQTGQFTNAIRTVNDIEKEFGPLPAAIVLRALAYDRSNQMDAALRDYRAVVEQDPANLQALIGAGEVARRAGNLPQALEWYGQAVETNPGQVAPRLMRARALWHLGDVETLSKTLAEDVATHPGSAWLMALRARIMVAGSDQTTIRAGMSLAVSVYRQQPTIFSTQTLAMGLAGLGRFQDAAIWQQMAVSSLFATASPGLFQLAQARLDRINSGETQWPEALDDFDTLSAPLPNPPPPPAF